MKKMATYSVTVCLLVEVTWILTRKRVLYSYLDRGGAEGGRGVKTSTFGTIAFNQFLPKRDRSAKDLFCSNTLSWSRNGARCISSISFGQKRSPENEILV